MRSQIFAEQILEIFEFVAKEHPDIYRDFHPVLYKDDFANSSFQVMFGNGDKYQIDVKLLNPDEK